jgi:chromosome segregation ATPase
MQAEAEELRQQLQAALHEAEQQQASLSAEADAHTAAQAANKELQQQLEQLGGALSKLQEQHKQLQGGEASLQQQLLELQQTHKQTATERQAALCRAEDLQQQLEATCKDLSQQVATLAETKQQLETAREAGEQQAQVCSRLDAERARLEDENGGLTASLSAAHGTLAEVQEQLVLVNTRVTEAVADRVRLQADLEVGRVSCWFCCC